MKLHPTTISSVIPSKQMGIEIASLRYDLLEQILMGMTDELQRQAFHDKELGRTKLSHCLNRLSNQFLHTVLTMTDILYICEPYIKGEKLVQLYTSAYPSGYASVNVRFTGFKLPV